MRLLQSAFMDFLFPGWNRRRGELARFAVPKKFSPAWIGANQVPAKRTGMIFLWFHRNFIEERCTVSGGIRGKDGFRFGNS